MHQQIRTVPAKSPADLAELLRVLKDHGVNIVAAGGGEVEKGGEFAFAVAHGEEQDAIQALTDEGYLPRLVDVEHEILDDRPGELHRFVAKVAQENRRRGYVIKDVSVGVPDSSGIPVQVYSEPA
jgi:hypothetical protein